MPKIIYKQQHIGDGGRKFSPSRNAHYVKYIGERENVLKNTHETNLVKYIGEREHAAKQIDKNVKIENKRLIARDIESKSNAEYDVEMKEVSEKKQTEPENGLFGYINGKFSDTYSTADMQKYVRSISTPHRNVFHSIFSFTPESAEQAGLNTLDDWENWTKYHISDIANGMNMKIENIEYLAAVHLKEGQPHVHIMWWDKEQQVLINKVDPLVCDKIRINVTQSTYRELFSDIYNKEEIMRRELRNDIGTFARKIANGTADDYALHILSGIQKVANTLPQKGQLKYKFLKLGSPAKTELDKLTHFIIDNNPAFRAQYDKICEQRLLYNQLLHSETSDFGNYKIKTYMKQVDDKLENAIGNEILRIIKSEFIMCNFDHYKLPEPNADEDEPREYLIHNTMTPHKEYIRWSAAFKQARSAVKEGRFDEAVMLYSIEAQKGNALALYEIGDLYRRGVIGGENLADSFYSSALESFMKLERTSSLKPYLQYRIGRMYFDGYGTEKDFGKAFDWLKKAADGGNHLSEYMIGSMYLFDNEHRDHEMATKYLKAAAKAGNAAAAKLLDRQEKWIQSSITKLMGSVSKLLAENIESSSADLTKSSSVVFGRGDLSKEQIKELLLKMQDKENIAEM